MSIDSASPTAPGAALSSARVATPHPARVIPLEGASNFRDVGGYATQDGASLRWGRVYRSDHLGQLTAADQQRVQALGLGTVLDFRGADERLAEPCAIPGAVVRSLAIEPTVVQRISEQLRLRQDITPEQVAEFMRQTYRDFVLKNTPQLRQFFAELRQANGPVVFHCTAGKDRTGIAAALLLHALGVHRDEVMADYLMTNDLLVPPKLARDLLAPDVRAVLWGVQPDFLQAAYDVMAHEHGGIDAYLSGPLGVDGVQRDALREQLLG